MDKKDKLKEVVDQAIASQHVPHVKLKRWVRLVLILIN